MDVRPRVGLLFEPVYLGIPGPVAHLCLADLVQPGVVERVAILAAHCDLIVFPAFLITAGLEALEAWLHCQHLRFFVDFPDPRDQAMQLTRMLDLEALRPRRLDVLIQSRDELLAFEPPAPIVLTPQEQNLVRLASRQQTGPPAESQRQAPRQDAGGAGAL